MRQVVYYEQRQLFYKVAQVLRSRAAWLYYKVRKKLLKSGADNVFQRGTIVTTKYGRYWKVQKLYYKLWYMLESKPTLL